MDDARLRLAVTAGRVGLFVVAIGTAWGAVTTAGGHGLGAQLVTAPAAAAANQPPAALSPSSPEVTARPAMPAPVSRAHVRAPIPLPVPVPRHVPASRRHVAR
jgi:hypothetical protein